MAKGIHKLSSAKAKAATDAGRYSDGGGLYLNITKGGSKSWAYMWTRDGRRREMGLGSYLGISRADARELAESCRQQVRKGLDPIQSLRYG